MNTRKRLLDSRKILIILIVVLFCIDCIISIYAIDTTSPEGPTIVIANKTRRTVGGPTSTSAAAGNVSQLTLTGSSTTQTWQGYYGNVTGMIRLDNAANQAMFTWRMPYPSGEIYASEISSVNWTSNNLRCYHFHNEPSSPGIFLDVWEYEQNSTAPSYAGLGLTLQSVDGVDETFSNASNAPGYPNFYTGTKYWNGTGGMAAGSPACPRTWLYNVSGRGGWTTNSYNTTAFTELMIWGNVHGPGANNARPIYVGLIKQYGSKGFNGKTYNYEMIVPDNGHRGNTAPTTYYFYVELE
jgi:hypothetical protein